MLTMEWATIGGKSQVASQGTIELADHIAEEDRYWSCVHDLVKRQGAVVEVPLDRASPVFFRLVPNESIPPLMVVKPEADAEIKRETAKDISEMLHDYMDEHGDAWPQETRSVARLFAQLAGRYA